MKFTCPKCGQHLDTDDDMAGLSVACPSCSVTLKVQAIDGQRPSTQQSGHPEAPPPLFRTPEYIVPERLLCRNMWVSAGTVALLAMGWALLSLVLPYSSFRIPFSELSAEDIGRHIVQTCTCMVLFGALLGAILYHFGQSTLRIEVLRALVRPMLIGGAVGVLFGCFWQPQAWAGDATGYVDVPNSILGPGFYLLLNGRTILVVNGIIVGVVVPAGIVVILRSNPRRAILKAFLVPVALAGCLSVVCLTFTPLRLSDPAMLRGYGDRAIIAESQAARDFVVRVTGKAAVVPLFVGLTIAAIRRQKRKSAAGTAQSGNRLPSASDTVPTGQRRPITPSLIWHRRKIVGIIIGIISCIGSIQFLLVFFMLLPDIKCRDYREGVWDGSIAAAQYREDLQKSPDTPLPKWVFDPVRRDTQDHYNRDIGERESFWATYGWNRIQGSMLSDGRKR